MVERRRHKRFASDLTIKLKRGQGAVRNVSADGIYFVADVRLKTGQQLKFALEFPNAPGGPIAAICTARIVRREAHGTRYGFGASISRLEFRRVAGP